MPSQYQALAREPKPFLDERPTRPQGRDKPKVLLIDDDRTIRRLVRAEIGEYCSLLEAENASIGISQYNYNKPDLAFIDIGLPDGDGQSLLSWMLHINPSAYAVMFSGHGENDQVFQAIENGAKGFITKPFDREKMMFFINQCMGK